MVNEKVFLEEKSPEYSDHIEEIAKDYHEICREMVNKQIGMITKPTRPYIEWNELTSNMKLGRMFIAKKLIEKYGI